MELISSQLNLVALGTLAGIVFAQNVGFRRSLAYSTNTAWRFGSGIRDGSPYLVYRTIHSFWYSVGPPERQALRHEWVAIFENATVLAAISSLISIAVWGLQCPSWLSIPMRVIDGVTRLILLIGIVLFQTTFVQCYLRATATSRATLETVVIGNNAIPKSQSQPALSVSIAEELVRIPAMMALASVVSYCWTLTDQGPIYSCLYLAASAIVQSTIVLEIPWTESKLSLTMKGQWCDRNVPYLIGFGVWLGSIKFGLDCCHPILSEWVLNIMMPLWMIAATNSSYIAQQNQEILVLQSVQYSVHHSVHHSVHPPLPRRLETFRIWHSIVGSFVAHIVPPLVRICGYLVRFYAVRIRP